MKSAGEALAAALLARAGAGAGIEIDWSRPWASATFEGMRHGFTVRLPAAVAARFAAGIEEAEFMLRRHLLIDIAVGAPVADGDAVLLHVEALTIEER